MAKFFSTQTGCLIQLAVVIVILIAVPGSIGQLVLLFGWWVATLLPLTRIESLVFLIGCAIFIVADILVTSQGIFTFMHADILGLPYYEFGMWGFYYVNGLRFLGRNRKHPWWRGD